jgi:hypothetical protein
MCRFPIPRPAPVFYEELGQGGEHIIGVEATGDRDRQALAAELIDNREHL